MIQLNPYEYSSENAVALAPEQVKKLPLVPFYHIVKSAEESFALSLLTMASTKQRLALLDIDLWSKDEISPEDFNYWVQVYSREELRGHSIAQEFIKSEQFQLYLKGKFNIYTFDLEEPEYPDHDHFFLTDDNLLLFEYDEEFPFADEIQEMIRDLYSEMGVEKAYAFLFKTVAEDFLDYQEQSYLTKKRRLEEFGFIDYYESLEFEAPFRSFEQVDAFIHTKKSHALPKIEIKHSHEFSLVSSLENNDIQSEIKSIEDGARLENLERSLVYMMNSSLSFHQGLKKGKIALKKVSIKTLNRIQLGYQYVRKLKESVLDSFDFRELYKIGNSLIRINQGILKKNQEFGTSFVGPFWSEFYQTSLEETSVRYKDLDGSEKNVEDLNSYESWATMVQEFSLWCKFFSVFQQTFEKLKASSQVMSTYYANYDLDDIDFEVLLLSCFANYTNSALNNSEDRKLGITIKEYRNLIEKLLANQLDLKGFVESFGLSGLKSVNGYLEYLIDFHLAGYNLSDVTEEKAKYLGGPLLLSVH